MKKILTFLMFGFAFVATPALSCEFTGQNQVPVGTLLGDASATGTSVAVGQLVGAFWGQVKIRAAFENAGCTQEQFVAKTVFLNGGNSNALLARSTNFIYPTPLPKAASTPPEPTVSAAPQFTAQAVVQSVPAATAPAAVTSVVAAPLAVEPLPVRVDMSDVWGAINALKASDASIRSGLNQVSPDQLTSQQLTLLNQLNAIPDLEARLRNLPASGEVKTSTLPVAQQVAVQQVIAAQSLAEEYVGRDVIDFSALLGGLGVILLSILGGLAYWNRNKNIASAAKTAVDGALAEVSLDDTFKLTVLTDIALLKSDVANIGEQTGATDKVDLGLAQLQALDALVVGDELDVDVFVNNKPEAVVRWRRTAENQLVILTKGIVDYTDGTPVAHPEKFVRKAYKDGRLRVILSPLVLTQTA